MTKFSDIKGFAFDLDGVITDTAKFHSIAWHKIADKVNSPWTDELAQNLKGIDRMASLEMILKAGNHENDYSEAQKQELAKEKNDYYVKLISKLTQADILPGMLDFINSLVANHYKLSLASVSRNAPTILKSLKLENVFMGIVDPATLKKGKPDPEIYLAAAKIMNLPPEQVIGLEDAAAGITSINGAKETSLGIGDAKVLADADLLFPDTAAVTLAAIQQKMTN